MLCSWIISTILLLSATTSAIIEVQQEEDVLCPETKLIFPSTPDYDSNPIHILSSDGTSVTFQIRNTLVTSESSSGIDLFVGAQDPINPSDEVCYVYEGVTTGQCGLVSSPITASCLESQPYTIVDILLDGDSLEQTVDVDGYQSSLCCKERGGEHAPKKLYSFAIPCVAACGEEVYDTNADADIPMAEDTNPADDVFETTITASLAEVNIDGTMVQAMAYNGQIPGPMIRVKEGDTVKVHFKNELPFSSTIHWHGVAGNHEADGSLVSQFAVASGGTFDYEFVAANAGNHWYHSHAKTAETLFKGLFGPLIVVSDQEEHLQEHGVLPAVEETLMLSDMTYDVNGNVADVYNVPELNKMNGIEGDTLLVNGKVNPSLEVEAGKPFMLRIINTSISRYWRLSLSGGQMIRVGGEDGLIDQAILEGGSHPSMSMDMTPISCSMDTDCMAKGSNYHTCMMPGMMGGEHDDGMTGGGHMGHRKTQENHGDMMGDGHGDGHDDMMMDTGTCGEMSMAGWDTGYDVGEIVLGPAMRATVVINPPQQENLVMQWKDFDRGVHTMDMDMGPMCTTMADCTPDYPMCMTMMGGMQRCGKMCSNSDTCDKPEFPQCMLMMQGGMPMCGKMVHGHTHRGSIDVLTIRTKPPQCAYPAFVAGTALSDVTNLSDIEPDLVWTGAGGMGHGAGHDGGDVVHDGGHGMLRGLQMHDDGMNHGSDVDMMMANRINLQGGMNELGTWFKIDDVQWSYGMGSTDAFPDPPASQRHAKLGQLIEFEVHNHSDMNHPFHLHGFSFQPISFMAMNHHMGTMKSFNYRSLEFMDTVDIPPHTSLIARVLLEDLVGHGAAVGRWLYHCHIAQHAELGMISEIHVAANDHEGVGH